MKQPVFLILVSLSGSFCQLSSLLYAGNLINNAANTYLSYDEEFRAQVYLEIQNYLDEYLTSVECEIISGVSTSADFGVSRGEKQALTVQQNNPGAGVKFLCGWSLSDNRMLYVGIDIRQQVVGRKPNALYLGFGDQNLNNFTNDFINTIMDNDHTWLAVQEYQKIEKPIQCCHWSVCVQAVMTTSHHSEAKVKLLPVLASNFGTQLKPNQSEVDRVLDHTQDCKRDWIRPSSGTRASPQLVYASVLILGSWLFKSIY